MPIGVANKYLLPFSKYITLKSVALAVALSEFWSSVAALMSVSVLALSYVCGPIKSSTVKGFTL